MQRPIYQKKNEYPSILPNIIKPEKSSHFWENYGFTNVKPLGHFSVHFFKTFIFFFHIYYLFYILHLLYNPNNLKWQPIKANKFSWFPNTLPINPPDPLLQRPHEGWGWRGENLMKSCEPLKNYFFSLTFIFQYIEREI